MTCSLDTYRQEVGVFAGILCKILHRKAKIAAKRIRGLRCSGFLARVTVLNVNIALLLRAVISQQTLYRAKRTVKSKTPTVTLT